MAATTYVDEAIHLVAGGAYVVVGVTIGDAGKAAARRAARRVPPVRGRRFHWHKEDERERLAMLQVIAAHAAGCIAYIATPASSRAREAIRQRCLGDVARTLAESTTTLDLVIESRQHRNDQHDASTLVTLRQSLPAATELAYAHQLPSGEPLLWLADALAGAVLALARRDSHYVTALPAGLLELHTAA